MKFRRKKHSSESRSIADCIFDAILIVFFTFFTFLCIFPFYYLFINTISANDLVSSGLINFYPKGVHLGNYIALKDVSDLGSSAFVTVARTIIGTALMVLCPHGRAIWLPNAPCGKEVFGIVRSSSSCTSTPASFPGT